MSGPALALKHLGVTVTIQESAGTDGAVVLIIDTEFEPDASDGGPGLRILVNEDPTYVGVDYEHKED
jgi:hypothetical protein